VQEKFPAQEGKGRDLLDLLAELKAEDVLGTKMGGAEFMEKVFAEGSKQVRVAAKRRRKQFGNRRKERQEKKSEAEAELKDERREWRVKHIEAFSGFMDRGDCSRIIDGDSAPIRERDLSAPSARELTKRIGSLRHFLRLVNGSSDGASSIDKIADEAGKPFGLTKQAGGIL
jgi:hypothetical protein